jgi:hypothetical protein
MSQKHKIGVFVIALVVLSTAVAATAFTSGSVERQANVNVVSDDAGLIGLSDGTSGDLVYQNSTGALDIDFTAGTANGANTEGHFELGNPSDAPNQSAFNVTNNDAEAHDMTFDYTLDGSEGQDTDANIEFQIYDSTGTQVGTISEESGTFTQNVASGDTLYVVVVVDTHGLDDTADLSGTLDVSV